MAASIWIALSASLGIAPQRAASARAAAARRSRFALLDFDRERQGLLVESLGVEEMDDDLAAWTDLSDRSLEPNAFFEAHFALSVARHLPTKSRPRFIAVWKHGVDGRRLMALCPVATDAVIGGGFAKVWLHKQAALATPLVDRDEAVPALRALLQWFDKETGAAGVLFPRTPQNGRLHKALLEAANLDAREMRVVEEFERAALFAGGDLDELWTREASHKALRELRRRERRLLELGPVEFKQYRRRDEIRVATEEFLALEASGWKQERGALLADPSLSTFVRSATRLLSQEGKCQIFSLTLSDRPIAMGIVIESQGRAFFWKIAFDETLRAQAPGVLLVYHLTKAQLGKTDIDLTDSCAIANHPMIGKFWPDRLPICDVAVQLALGRGGGFAEACGKESLRRRLRGMAKTTFLRLLGRKAS